MVTMSVRASCKRSSPRPLHAVPNEQRQPTPECSAALRAVAAARRG